MPCRPDDAEGFAGGSAAPLLLECCGQAGGVKHLDGRAISGEFELRAGDSRTLTGSYVRLQRGALPLIGM